MEKTSDCHWVWAGSMNWWQVDRPFLDLRPPPLRTSSIWGKMYRLHIRIVSFFLVINGISRTKVAVSQTFELNKDCNPQFIVFEIFIWYCRTIVPVGFQIFVWCIHPLWQLEFFIAELRLLFANGLTWTLIAFLALCGYCSLGLCMDDLCSQPYTTSSCRFDSHNLCRIHQLAANFDM